MTIRARRAARIAAASALAFGGLLSAAPGCTTNTCVNGSCTVTFKDGARSATVGGLDDAKVELVGVDGDRVRVVVAGNAAVVTRDVPQPVGRFQVKATEVSPKKVVLKISK
ncbi:hypothetical protein [Actinomadura yumaensis]|uniref:Uncharacterized protein n=1 Tax=Actinomadura yumaensis TaxID=111807 RepID=A0ABW2CF94_9ACTN